MIVWYNIVDSLSDLPLLVAEMAGDDFVTASTLKHSLEKMVQNHYFFFFVMKNS